MKLITERLLISDEHQMKYDLMSNIKKQKYIKKFLEFIPNAKNLTNAQDFYIAHIFEKGFDDSENIFLKYMQKVPYNISITTAQLVEALLDNGSLQLARAPWLLNKTLYEEGDVAINFKIKALTWASNPTLQNTDKPIDFRKLVDNRGFIKSSKSIENILKNIKTMPKSKSSDVDATVGKEILKNYLNVQNLNPEVVHSFIEDEILPNDGSKKLFVQYLNSGDLDDEIEKVLDKKHTSAMGREPIDILKSHL